jgi:hypothetical protein
LGLDERGGVTWRDGQIVGCTHAGGEPPPPFCTECLG